MTVLLEERANKKMESLLDSEDYDATQLMSIRIPADYLSYANNTRDFKRANGEVDISGLRYNFVKWRVYDGMLELLCLPNIEASNFKNISVDLFKLINDLQNGQNKKSNPS